MYIFKIVTCTNKYADHFPVLSVIMIQLDGFLVWVKRLGLLSMTPFIRQQKNFYSDEIRADTACVYKALLYPDRFLITKFLTCYESELVCRVNGEPMRTNISISAKMYPDKILSRAVKTGQ